MRYCPRTHTGTAPVALIRDGLLFVCPRCSYHEPRVEPYDHRLALLSRLPSLPFSEWGPTVDRIVALGAGRGTAAGAR